MKSNNKLEQSMNLNSNIVISVEGPQDSAQLRRLLMSLQNNLSQSGITSKSAAQLPVTPDPSVEYRSDVGSLYSLALTFIGSGAAVALINAIRATFDSARGATFKFALTMNGRQIDIDAAHLRSGEVDKLTELLHEELGKTKNSAEPDHAARLLPEDGGLTRHSGGL
jgi:hypothetical protein